MSDDHFLARWSRRKLASKAAPAAAAEATGAGTVPAPVQTPSPTPAQVPADEKPPEPLPPVESLTPDSDFTPFMKDGVDPDTRRQALRTLVRDARFDVMDGLDVYIDDYSKPDPIPADWLGKMSQLARLGDFRREEPQSPGGEENSPAGAQTSPKAEEEQPLAAPEIVASEPGANKGIPPGEVEGA